MEDMFSGIVEEQGIIIETEQRQGGLRLQVSRGKQLSDLQLGDSVAVNGCCLTVTDLGEDDWCADVVEETLNKTNLGELVVGDKVNLEGAMRLNERIGGHLVQGHVDGQGQILKRDELPDGSAVVTIGAPAGILKYVIEKGSIAVNGVSLTVFEVEKGQFSFAMIPHTAMVTNLGSKKVNDRVNLEVDLMAKYVEIMGGQL